MVLRQLLLKWPAAVQWNDCLLPRLRQQALYQSHLREFTLALKVGLALPGRDLSTFAISSLVIGGAV